MIGWVDGIIFFFLFMSFFIIKFSGFLRDVIFIEFMFFSVCISLEYECYDNLDIELFCFNG